MHTVHTARHPDDVDLTWEQIRDVLGALEGSRVSVRVVARGDPEMLLTVFAGTLGPLGHGKQPALFWPVRVSKGQPPGATQDAEVRVERDRDHTEGVGFYLHPDRFEGAVGRAGLTVLAISQGPVLINVRRS